MKFHNSNVLLATFIITVLVIGIYTTANYLFPTIDDDSSALTYGSNTDISFTINPKLSIATSANSLTIDNLVPGTTSDSNKVSVTVSSNTQYGYVLSAGVGSTLSTEPYYSTSDLVHENSTISNVFSSVDTSASLETLDTDNTWGYSTSTDGGTSWSAYSGLSSTTTKPLLDVSNPAAPSTIDFKIAARSASTQASGTYNNVITFYAVGKPEPPRYLYDEVAKMSKGTQSVTDLQAEITSPTSRDYRDDTSNSGVYEYNSAVFGESSDASNTNKIYYYRGILEPEEDQGLFGSNGQATAYPNYVKLDNDTCWRIVRTTGSGGVKMVYNGTWVGATCAQFGYSTTIRQASFAGGFNGKQVVRVGYTYDSTYAVNIGGRVGTLAQIFGTNTSDNNTSDSNIKTLVDTWYNNNMNSYTEILEGSAGYCGDRSMYNASGALQPESLKISLNNSGSGIQTLYFGAYIRNRTASQSPSLTCAKYNDGTTEVDRSKVDLYSISGASTGNGRLLFPVALLTADEVSFAGSGSAATTEDSSYNAKSYINANIVSTTLSPYFRDSLSARGVSQSSTGLLHNPIDNAHYARPAISLKSGVVIDSGSGTAADPWVVTAP